MTLHTWNKSSAQAAPLAACLAVLAEGDTLLLLEDGVYLALDQAFLQRFTPVTPALPRLCVLSTDLAARGISARISPVATVIDYKEFVDLCLQHLQVVNWV
jgi:tRNA 2-thiouridine synthesizing protein B